MLGIYGQITNLTLSFLVGVCDKYIAKLANKIKPKIHEAFDTQKINFYQIEFEPDKPNFL